MRNKNNYKTINFFTYVHTSISFVKHKQLRVWKIPRIIALTRIETYRVVFVEHKTFDFHKRRDKNVSNQFTAKTERYVSF